MEYRQLGNSGLKISELTLGTMTFGGQGGFAKVGAISLAEARRLIDLVADAGVNLIDTADVYSAGARRRHSRRGDGRQAPARHADRLQGALHHGPGPERQGPVALAPDPRLRSEPQAPAHRRHRPLSGPPMGRADAARRDARGARQPRARGQGALRRLLQFLRLARDEGDGDRAPRRPHSRSCRSRSTTRCRRARPNTS